MAVQADACGVRCLPIIAAILLVTFGADVVLAQPSGQPVANAPNAAFLDSSLSNFSLDGADPPTSQPTTMPTTTAPAAETLDDIWTREKLTGHWFGLRPFLAEHGLTFDLRLSQFYQGVVYGGAQEKFTYGGMLDYVLDVDGHKLGLWEGFFVNLHAQTQFGRSINSAAGGAALPNTAMLYPLPNEQETAITGLLVMQMLNKNVGVFGGKLNVIDLYTKYIFPHIGSGGLDGFQNTNILAPAMPYLRWVNLSLNGGGAFLFTDDGRVQGAIIVGDTNNSTTTTGTCEMFNNGAVMLGLYKFFFELDDKPGNVLVAFGGSTRTYDVLEENVVFEADGAGLSLEQETGAWTWAWYFDQIVWQDLDNTDRKVRFFTGMSGSDGHPSFGNLAGIVTLEGHGLIPGREKDRMGIGASYVYVSRRTKTAVQEIPLLGANIGDIWATEVYYNFEVTPWFHLTPSLQVVQSENKHTEPAMIVGLRAVLEL